MCEQTELLKVNKLIYMDTCTILNSDSFIQFMNNNEQKLIDCGKKIILIGAVDYELKEHLKSEYWHLKTNANKALNYIYTHKHLFEIHERKPYETFADPEFQMELLRNRRFKNQLFITEDHKLARDILKFNDFESCDGKVITIATIDNCGQLHCPEYLNEIQDKPVKEEVELKENSKYQQGNWFKLFDTKKAKDISFATMTLIACTTSIIVAPIISNGFKRIVSKV